MKILNSIPLTILSFCLIPINLSAATMEMQRAVFFDMMQRFSDEPVNTVEIENPLDYTHCKISDAQYTGTVSLESVLSKVKHSLTSSTYATPSLQLTLSENYLTEVGFAKLVDFFVAPDNQEIFKSIAYLNLSNNRIRSSAKEDILRLLKAFPNMKLDLSINYLSLRDLLNIDQEVQKRIIIRN